MIGKGKLVLFGAGLLFGTAGTKILTGKAAKKACVKAVAAGLKAKAEFDRIVEAAKANVDDIVAEAKYTNDKEPGQ